MRIGTWSMKSRLALKLTLVATLYLTQSSLIAQVSDTRPPKLASLCLSPLTVQVSAGPQPLAISMDVTDDLAGVSFVKVTVTSPSGKQDQFALLSLTGGDNLNGIWNGAITMPQFSEAGLWRVKSIEVWDGVGNLARFDNSMLQTMAFPSDFTLVSRPEDLEPPPTNKDQFYFSSWLPR